MRKDETPEDTGECSMTAAADSAATKTIDDNLGFDISCAKHEQADHFFFCPCVCLSGNESEISASHTGSATHPVPVCACGRSSATMKAVALCVLLACSLTSVGAVEASANPIRRVASQLFNSLRVKQNICLCQTYGYGTYGFGKERPPF
eukprot:5183364-Amphidinium_carterae.2